MSGIRSKNTKPELIIRKGLHSRGFRFRLHSSGLPGKPDLVFPKYKAVIFVNGCFWHGHDCNLFKWPSTRLEFWKNKIERNRFRDTEVMAALEKKGWKILLVWECALKGKGKIPLPEVLEECATWLTGTHSNKEIKTIHED